MSKLHALLAVYGAIDDIVSASQDAEVLKAADEFNADATQEVWHRADLRLALSVVPRATGDHALERRMLEEAALMYGRKEIRSYDAEIRRRLTQLGRQGP